MKNIKVLIAPIEVAGYMKGLKKGFDCLEIECETYEFSKNKFYFKVGEEKKKKSFSLFYMFLKIFKLKKILLLIRHFFIFLFCLFKYDIFIFLFGCSFFKLKDLWLLKLMRKKIVFIFLGSDSRPPYINGVSILDTYDDKSSLNEKFLPQDVIEPISNKKLYIKTKQTKKKIYYIEKYADVIINHKPTSLFHEKPFYDFLLIGYPFSSSNFDKNSSIAKNKINNNIKILHAPSRPLTKGTYEVRNLVNIYKKKGFQIDFIELINVPNKEVLKHIRNCDFIFDSIYSDTPLGGLGIEGAFFGKPTLISGYYAKYIHQELPEEAIPPSYYVEPEKLEEAFKRMLVDSEFRIQLGKKAQEFALNQWNPKLVAQKILKIIDGSSAEGYLINPKELHYFLGSAIKKEVLIKKNKEYYHEYGKKGFFLQDKSKLEKSMIDFLENRG